MALDIGKLWMPQAQGIGPYSGKETIALVVWFASWAILRYALRRRQVNLTAYGIAFLAILAVTTTLLWPPITHEVVRIFYEK